MKKVVAAAAAGLAALTAAPALAAPSITSLELELATEDAPARLVVRARDADAPVSGVTVVRPGEGSFGSSGCRLGERADTDARFVIPLPGGVESALGMRVSVTSGGCSQSGESTSRDVGLDVPQVPGIPLPDPPRLITLPDLLGGLPIARLSAASDCEGADEMPRGSTRRVVALAIVCLVNRERRRRGLPAVSDHALLQRAASSHSEDMRTREYFSHVGPGGRPTLPGRLKEAGYWPASAGENIGAATDDLATPRAIVDAWMHSRGHRANILDPRWRDVGVGVVSEYPAPPEPGGTYTLLLGRRDGAAAPVPTPVGRHGHRNRQRKRRPAPRPERIAPCTGTDAVPAGRTRRTIRVALICLVNRFRVRNGRDPLEDSAPLQTAAFAQSYDMRVRQYFDHTGPSGLTFEDRLFAVGFWPATGAELIVQAVDGRSTPKQVMAGLLERAKNREVLLERDWREIGVGVVTEYSAPAQVGGTFTLVLARMQLSPGRLVLPAPVDRG